MALKDDPAPAAAPIRLAIVGLGKIARDQHLPAIAATKGFDLAGIASPAETLQDVPCHADLHSLLKAIPDIQAVALCTPPQVRYQIARFALESGLHVLLEKPPCVSVSEAQALADLAHERGLSLLATWHSRFAPAVEPARHWVESQPLKSVSVAWKENVRIWHPGQAWIWKAGGLGVFDPAINALSILTHILPGRLMVRRAELRFPTNSDTPIAARLELASSNDVPVTMDLDFLHLGEPQWQIDLYSAASHCQLQRGGDALSVDGSLVPLAPAVEYRGIYAHFSRLIAQRSIEADLRPLQLVADALLCGQRIAVAPFVE